jgi:hypothetical protein
LRYPPEALTGVSVRRTIRPGGFKMQASDMLWLNVMNAALGIAVLVCGIAILAAALGDWRFNRHRKLRS